jgi:DNA-binding transcriptional MerR regulator
MNKNMYTIGEFAKLTNVTERTLRYYEQKGLFKPSLRNEHGHRFYTEKDLISLQKILSLKFIDYSLEDIAEYLNKSGEDLKESLDFQTDLLQKKKVHLEQILWTIDRVKTIIEDHGERYERDLILALIYSLQTEQDMKKWLAGHVSQPLIDRMFMDEQSTEERIASEKKIIGIFADINNFYNENRPIDDKLVQEKAIELMTQLSHVFKPENLTELEKAAAAMEDVPHLHLSPVSKEAEDYLTEVLKNIDKKHIKSRQCTK